jgi:FKBP-type peptidyl-prolyl cis-trans isomerase
LLARYTSLGIAIALAFVLAACGSGGGTSTTPSPTVDTSAQPTNVPIPTVSVTPTVTNDGLQIFEIQLGTGQEAQAGDTAYVNYKEWLPDATSIDDTLGVSVRQILRPGEILDGLIEGITGMKVGGKRRLIIPPALGFGAQSVGNTIPPNSTLIYDIELTDVHVP